MDKLNRIKELIEILNKYRDQYYNESNPSVSDSEYDKMFDELSELEKETGIYFSNSPTQSVGYEVKSKLNKVKHNHPMLSLDKTKSVPDIVKFFKHQPGIAMLKMDGLTCSLAYNNDLVSAESRGNGEIGEDLLHNAKVVTNIPLRIDHDDLIVDGEMIIDYPTFEKINSKMPEGSKFKNPRNLCSGSIRQLDSKIAAERGIKFVAWKCIKGIDDNDNDFAYRLDMLRNYGFEVVPFITIDKNPTEKEIEQAIKLLKDEAETNGYPIDGIVFGYRDIAYGESLGMTSHHLNSQIAFKFYDEEVETTLLNVEYTMGKTGALCPTAVFEPVEIDGTIVERSSLHNISVMRDEIGIVHRGQKVFVFKANQIIPQISYADQTDVEYELSLGNNLLVPPAKCPICGAKTEIRKDKDTEVLYCTSDSCSGKLLGKLNAFVSKQGMNIDGLSEATLELLLNKGYINSYRDIFHLNEYKAELSSLPRMAAKSVSNLLKSIEHSRKVTLDRFLTSLSIPLCGKSTCKDIAGYCHGSIDEFIFIINNTALEFMTIEGFGNTMFDSLIDWWETNDEIVHELIEELEFEVPEDKTESIGSDLNSATFCVTGKLVHFANRDALIQSIESHNGKYLSSVSSKLNYLINNDKTSTSGKNKKALENNVKIISEADYLEMIK